MPDSNEALATTGLTGILESLTERAKKLAVTDQATYTAAANFLIEAKSYVKDVGHKLDPGINSAKTHLDYLKNQKAGYVDPVKRLIDIVQTNAENWRAEEKRRAEAETRRKQEELDRQAKEKAELDRRAAEKEAADAKRAKVAEINEALASGAIGKREAAKRLKEAGAEEEAAKATAAAVAEEEKNKPAPVVRVAPSVPTVAGVKNQTYYFAEVTDRYELIEAFATACETDNVERREFLQRFIAVDETEVARYAREVKNPTAVMSSVPGVRAWSKG
jgi:hypothetical protein